MMRTVGLGPFPISAYGLPDKDDYLVDNAYTTYRGGYDLGIGGDGHVHENGHADRMLGRETRLNDTHEGLGLRSSHSAYWNEFEGFSYKNREWT